MSNRLGAAGLAAPAPEGSDGVLTDCDITLRAVAEAPTRRPWALCAWV